MTDPTIEATIISMLVRGACLSALAIAIGALLYGRCSAHTLTMLWRGTLAALCLLPLFSILSPPIPILPARGGLPAEQAISVPPVAGAIPTLSIPAIDPGGQDSAVPEPGPSAAVASTSSAPWLVFAWCAGLAMVLSRWLFAVARVRRLWNSGRPVDAQGWGAGAGVRLRVSDQVSLPMTWGVRRPAVLLPGDAEDWDAQTRRAVIDHELAHARGGDSRFLLIAQLATAIHWMNPLVWIIGRRLRDSQERVADDSVLATGHDAGDYASLLLSFAKRSPQRMPLSASAMAHPSTVGKRIERVLDEQQHRGQLARLPCVLGCAAVLVTTALISAAAPQAAPVRDAGDEKLAALDAVGERGQAKQEKLDSIIIPKISMTELTLRQTIDLFSGLVKQHDPEKAGVPFRVVDDGDPGQVAINDLQLANVPAGTALKFITQLAGVDYIIKSTGVEVGNGVAHGRETRSFRVPEKLAAEIGRAPSASAYWSRLGVDLPDGSRITAPAEKGGFMSAVMIPDTSLQTIEKRIALALRSGDKPTRTAMEERLDGIIIPQLEFNEATVEEAVDFLRRKSQELDPEKNPQQRGVNILIKSHGGGQRQPDEGLITLSLKDVSLRSAITRLADLAGMTADFTTPFGITLETKSKE